MMLIHHYNISMMKLNPFMRRSKLQQSELFKPQHEKSHSHHQQLKKGVNLGQQNALTAPIIPRALLEPPRRPEQPAKHLFNPLNYEWKSYPAAFQQHINRKEQYDSRGIGYYKEYFWYFYSNEIILQHIQAEKPTILQVEHKIDVLAIGEIDNCSLYFKKKALFVVAAAIQNVLHLYGIDQRTLKLNQFSFNHQMVNSRVIQKIKFINNHEIVVATDTCKYCVIEFGDDIRIRQEKTSLLRAMLPSMSILYPSANYFVEDVIVSGNILYSLVRIEKKASWFSIKSKKILSSVTKENSDPVYVIQEKRIDVYEIDRALNSLKLKYHIKQKDIIKKLTAYSEVNSNTEAQSLRIVSIYMDKKVGDEQQLLSFVTKCGYFITIKQGDTLSFVGNPIMIPKANSVGIAGFNIVKKDQVIDEQATLSFVKQSLGYGNLTMMNDSIWYLDDGSIEAIKCQEFTGQICEIKGPVLEGRKWIIFTDSGYYIIKRLTRKEILLGYLHVKQTSLKNVLNKSINEDSSFLCFLDNFAKIEGAEKICEGVIQIFLDDQKTYLINSQLISMIKDELSGQSSKDYRDWGYELDMASVASAITVKDTLEEELWKYFLEIQYRMPKYNKSGNACSAYWHGLTSIFYRIIQGIISLKPSDSKANLYKISNTIKLLDKLSFFFVLKQDSQNQFMLQVKKEALKANRVELFSRQTMKKEEETEATVDQSNDNIIARNLSEANRKMETIIDGCLVKIKAISKMFWYLADYSEMENLPSLIDIVKDKKNQMLVKKYLMARMEDKEKLKEFDRDLPELEIQKDLKYMQWLDIGKMVTRIEQTNLNILATLVSSNTLPKTLQLLTPRYDMQTDLLLLYHDYLSGQLYLTEQKLQIDRKQDDVFLEQKKDIYLQKKDYICSQMKFIEAEVHKSIKRGINSYLSKSTINEKEFESILYSILQIVAEHDDVSLNNFLENEIKMQGIAELNIDFSKMKKKQRQQRPIDWKVLFLTEKQIETQSCPHLVSNFELLSNKNQQNLQNQ